jgi:diguanylate cyclase (GGDEF)-like protein
MRYAYLSAATVALVALAADRQRLAYRLRQAHHDATHDPLTGLLNRRGLNEAATAVGNGSLTVLVDLVGFKAVNDSYGHATGDAILHEIAARLSDAPGVALAARLGGDEFAAVLMGSPDALLDLYARLIVPVTWHGRTIPIGATLGAAMATRPLSVSLGRADVAMYRARAERVATAIWRSGRDPDPTAAPRPSIRCRDLGRPASRLARLDVAA